MAFTRHRFAALCLTLGLGAFLAAFVAAQQSAPSKQAAPAPSRAQQGADQGRGHDGTAYDQQIGDNARRMMEQGKQIFRHDTFGSEDFWGGKLRLHESIAGEALGGVGAGVSPNAALALGLKVDAEALPAELVEQIKAGKVDLD